MLPSDAGQVHVVIKTGETVVAEKDVDTASETAVSLQVSGTGTVTYDLLINGELKESKPVDFNS